MGVRRCPPRVPGPGEIALLRLIAEQCAIPFDQLARFAGCDRRRAEHLAEHLATAGWAEYGRFLVGEPPWVWLTHRGARLSGSGFRAYQPRVGAMERIRAVNEVRLQIARRAPQARWLSARSLVRAQGRRGRRPHAVVKIGGERHAILVKLGSLGPEWLEREIIEAHMARYDAVVAFAAPRPRCRLERLAAKSHWPKLVIRPIPMPPA